MRAIGEQRCANLLVKSRWFPRVTNGFHQGWSPWIQPGRTQTRFARAGGSFGAALLAARPAGSSR